MAAVMINSGDSAGTGEYLNKSLLVEQAKSGVNAEKTMSATMNIGSVWQEPKDNFIAKVFPSDSTWHFLYTTDDVELTNTLFSIESDETLDEQTKKYQAKRVEEVVKESYVVGAMSVCYITTGIFIILLLVTIICLFVGVDNTVVYIIAGISGFFLLSAIGSYVYASAVAKGKGESRWSDYSNDLNSKLNSGKTMASILDEFSKNKQSNLDRQARSRDYKSRRPASSGLLSNLLAGGIGFAAGRNF